MLINGRPLASFGSNDGALLTRITPASYMATLSGLAPNCRLVGGDTGRVHIRSGVTTPLSFEIGCSATERIAFVSERDGRPQIYVMELDGTGQARLTFDGNSNKDPTWSPDGNKIAFASSTDSLGTNIVIANVDRSAFNTLGGEGAKDGYPAWSPNGSQIAFSSFRTGNHELFIMNSDGTNARQITNSPDVDLRPAWSPDGGRIFFDAAPPAPYLFWNLWTINVDGSARTQLTTRPSVRINPQISPDGTKIVYQSVFSDSDIYGGINLGLLRQIPDPRPFVSPGFSNEVLVDAGHDAEE
jgi:Tol biopolymer transport system component